LRVYFGDTVDAIVLRGVGLNLIPDPESPIMQEIEALKKHTHVYLTGKGVGHNNTEAITSEPVEEDPPLPPSPEPPKKPKKPKK
jgi:uncharacterized protein YgfB (UPF0149 family)